MVDQVRIFRPFNNEEGWLTILNQQSIGSDKLLEIIQMQTEVAQQGIDLGGIMDLVVQKAQMITAADGASVELMEGTELVYSAVSGMAQRFIGLRLNMANSLSGESIVLKVPLISDDIELDDRVNKAACRQIGLRSMIVVPLIFHDDAVGVIKVLCASAGFFTQEHVAILEMMSGLIAAAMHSALKNEKSELFHKATHDSLTGMPNRSLFYDRLRKKLQEAQRQETHFSILSMDLDGLKEINDNLGHRAGDAAIHEVAARAHHALRESDTVARVGGDEFAVIAATTADRKGLEALIKRLEEDIGKPFSFEGKTLQLVASIGGALFCEDGANIETLIEKADHAMYEVKRKHKSRDLVRW